MPARSLPVVNINGVSYFVDEHLQQLRNVVNPHDAYDIDSGDETGEEPSNPTPIPWRNQIFENGICIDDAVITELRAREIQALLAKPVDNSPNFILQPSMHRIDSQGNPLPDEEPPLTPTELRQLQGNTGDEFGQGA